MSRSIGSSLPPALRSICISSGRSLPKEAAHRRWPMISAPGKSWFPVSLENPRRWRRLLPLCYHYPLAAAFQPFVQSESIAPRPSFFSHLP